MTWSPRSWLNCSWIRKTMRTRLDGRSSSRSKQNQSFGATLSMLPDDSILASGENPPEGSLPCRIDAWTRPSILQPCAWKR